MRDAILKAVNDLQLPVKTRRTNTRLANESIPPPRGRLCTPPSVLKALSMSGNVPKYEEGSASLHGRGCSFAMMQDDYDMLVGGLGWFDRSIGYEESDDTVTGITPNEDDDVFYDRKDVEMSDVKTLKYTSDDKETISSTEEDNEDSSHWEDEFPTDAHVFDELRSERDGDVSMTLSPAPEHGSRETSTESKAPLSNRHARTQSSTPQEPAAVMDLTIRSPDTATHRSSPLKPFVRSAFPKAIKTLSLLPNISPSRRILTCFRIADILRAATSPDTTFLEIYTAVISSSRAGLKQHFIFTDLFFPARPPQISGTYVGWQGIDLFEDDTRPFLKARKDKPVMCRAICVLLRKEGSGIKPSAPTAAGIADIRLKVLSIWRAEWGDVGYAKGLIL